MNIEEIINLIFGYRPDITFDDNYIYVKNNLGLFRIHKRQMSLEYNKYSWTEICASPESSFRLLLLKTNKIELSFDQSFILGLIQTLITKPFEDYTIKEQIKKISLIEEMIIREKPNYNIKLELIDSCIKNTHIKDSMIVFSNIHEGHFLVGEHIIIIKNDNAITVRNNKINKIVSKAFIKGCQLENCTIENSKVIGCRFTYNIDQDNEKEEE